MVSVGELQQYMKGLFEIMMGRLEAYQFISPHIFLVAQKSQLLVEHLIDNPNEIGAIHGESVVKGLIMKIEQMYNDAMENVNGQIKTTVTEIGAVIKQELKKAIGKEILQCMSPDKRAV